jgi:hypothetical protein
MRLLARLAWPITALSAAILAVTLYLGLTRPSLPGVQPFTDIQFTISFWIFSLVGALITQRQPKNPIGPVCLGIGFRIRSLPGLGTTVEGRIPVRVMEPVG